jgi:hypothetical protein
VFEYVTDERSRRLSLGTDYTNSVGKVYDLAELVGPDGRLQDPRRPGLLESRPLNEGSRNIELMIYAVGEDHTVHVGFDAPNARKQQMDGAVKHETLYEGAPVRAAGEIYVKGGIICAINDASGTYGTRGVILGAPGKKAMDVDAVRDLLEALRRCAAVVEPELLADLCRKVGEPHEDA